MKPGLNHKKLLRLVRYMRKHKDDNLTTINGRKYYILKINKELVKHYKQSFVFPVYPLTGLVWPKRGGKK